MICFFFGKLATEIERVDLRADEGSPSHGTGFRPACRTIERPRQKQAGQAPSGNRGAVRQQSPPRIPSRSATILACQPRKLDEEARNQESEVVKSYGGFGTFEPLGPILAQPAIFRPFGIPITTARVNLFAISILFNCFSMAWRNSTCSTRQRSLGSVLVKLKPEPHTR